MHVSARLILSFFATGAPGTFGRVLECWDRKNKDYCAVKIVRNVKKYRDAAMIEVRSAMNPRICYSIVHHLHRFISFLPRSWRC